MTKIKFTTSSTEEALKKINGFDTLNYLFGDIEFEISTIQIVLFVFKAFPKDDNLHNQQDFKRLRRKTQSLEIYLILDYERIMQGSDEENLSHIKEVFVKGCETFLKPMKGFKWEEFEAKINGTI